MSGVFKRHNRAVVAVNVLFLSKIRRKNHEFKIDDRRQFT